MNELPDDLWWSERSRMRATQDPSVRDAEEETGDSLFTTVSTDRLVVLGTVLIFCSCAVTALLAVMGTWSTILMMQRLKGFGSVRAATRG